MEPLPQGKCILVTDYAYFPIVFKLKANHPDAEWKVLTKEDLLDRLSFSFHGDPIPYLLQKGIDYGNAKKYLRLLRVADINKNEKLSAMFEDLEEQGYLESDEYGRLEISRSNVYLLELQEDQELHSFLTRLGVPVTDISLTDLGASPRKESTPPAPLYSFPNKFAQYFYIYADIRKRLLEEADAKKKLSVLIQDESDLYYVNLAASLFGIPSFAVFRRPFLSVPAVKQKANAIYQSKSFVFSEEESKNPELAQLKQVVDHYGLASLPFDFAYACLLEIGNTLGVQERMDDRGITIEKRFTIDPDVCTYVTNFQYGVFYQVYDDKNVLTDEELVQISANPSYVATKLDRRKKLNYLLYNNILMLSRVRQHLTDKIYDSPFFEELGWGKPSQIMTKMGMNKEGVYTTEASQLYYADQLDKQFYGSRYQDYRSYDHAYKGIREQVVPADKNWSITNLETYIDCPFKYYLSQVLPDNESDKYSMWLGTLIHKVMETVWDPDFDYEKAYADGLAEFKKSMTRSNQEFGPKEEAWLEIVHYWLEKFVKSIAKGRESAGVIQTVAEKKVNFELTGTNGDIYHFHNAKVDKVIVTEWGSEKFYTIIDYKSGSESFNPDHVFLGKSVQLPLYYFAIENAPNHRDFTDNGRFGGFDIVHSYIGKASKIEGNITKVTQAKGLSRTDSSYWHSIDATGFTSKGEIAARGGKYFYNGYRFTAEHADEHVPHDVHLPYFYNFAYLVEEAKVAMVHHIEAILRNEFPIQPTSFDLMAGSFGKLVCAYCPYGDICYRNAAKDKKSYAAEIKAHFGRDQKDLQPTESEEKDHE